MLGSLAAALFAIAIVGWVKGWFAWWEETLILLFAVCLAVAAVLRSVMRLLREHRPVQSAAAHFLHALVSGDLRAAHACLDDDLRAATSLDEFSQTYGGQGRLAGFRIANTAIVGPGPPHADIDAVVGYADGRAGQLKFRLVRRRDGTWRVAGGYAGQSF